jgi:hypothetical protein
MDHSKEHGTERADRRRRGSPTAAVGGALAVGVPSYDAVLAEHTPAPSPDGGWCRACGFAYLDEDLCPAVILAEAGFPQLADRVRVVPETDREHGALCELTVAVKRMGAQLEAIGAAVAAAAPARKARQGRARPRRVAVFARRPG